MDFLDAISDALATLTDTAPAASPAPAAPQPKPPSSEKPTSNQPQSPAATSPEVSPPPQASQSSRPATTPPPPPGKTVVFGRNAQTPVHTPPRKQTVVFGRDASATASVPVHSVRVEPGRPIMLASGKSWNIVVPRTSSATAATNYRKLLVEEADRRVGSEIISKAVWDKTRQTCKNYTTCLDFANQVKVATDKLASLDPKGFYPMKFKEVNPAMKQSLPAGVWVPFGPGARPKVGDFLITVSPSTGYFLHVSIVRNMEPGDKGTEAWTTIDGGGLKAVKRTHYLDPTSGDFRNKNQLKYGWKARYRVSGWIDVDLLEAARLGSAAAASSPAAPGAGAVAGATAGGYKPVHVTGTTGPEAPTPPAAPPNTSDSKYRKLLVEEADRRVGSEIISKAVWDKTRQTCKNYTTCLDFANQVKVATDKLASLDPKGFYPMKFKQVNRAMKQSFPAGVWKPFGPGARPKIGDFLITVSPSTGYFLHVSIVRNMEPGDKGTEAWSTIDGGGLKAVKRTHYLDPTSGDFRNKNQLKYGWEARYRVSGWIDVDLLEAARTGFSGSAPSPAPQSGGYVPVHVQGTGAAAAGTAPGNDNAAPAAHGGTPAPLGAAAPTGAPSSQAAFGAANVPVQDRNLFLAVQKVYHPHKSLVLTSPGNGSRPVFVVLPQDFDPNRPHFVQTHYHGLGSWAHGGSHVARVKQLVARTSPLQAVVVLPESGNMSRERWTNVVSQVQTTADAEEAVRRELNSGPLKPQYRGVSFHSAGGDVFRVINKLGADRLRGDRMELLDCLYNAGSLTSKGYPGVTESVVAVGRANPNTVFRYWRYENHDKDDDDGVQRVRGEIIERRLGEQRFRIINSKDPGGARSHNQSCTFLAWDL